MTVAEGARLGPYEILSPLGAGGMGEVYRARDPRLGREVAVKVLPEAVATDPDRLRRFEHEARAVAALNHPNILTVHDVGTHDGSPYVVTELLEGETLRDVLQSRAPTPRQVLSWGLQAAQGLAAAHQKGIVHRDVKPENLFLTTDGRLKILDFGLAKLVALGGTDTEVATASGPSQAGVIVGTIAYMSPEQVGAEPLDHRSDLFSLGIVLYELLSREQPFRRPTVAATLSAILHDDLPDLAVRQPGISAGVDRVVRRCLEKRREERYQSAHDLAKALESVLEGGSASATLRDVEERSPYPGLSSFTENDAERFFGREEEVAALWARLKERRLLAVIGPSGAGKSSFVRAGVVAGRPEGWAAIVSTPGNAPLRGLGRTLAPQLAHDPDALGHLVTFEDPDTALKLLGRWRRGHDEALLVIDQFEELFTLNPPEVQARFASLLGRLAGEADLHVLLSLRDDFLMRCTEQPELAPVFRELTPLRPMTREGLRRALVEPAARRGYRFEDQALVDEMVGAVEGARGALPLLAFAVSRLWERRRPVEKLLTREAYVEIGGVAGALARHAEETMERIGAAHEGTVRELFRNLTTAQGTRAVLDREELLSALPDRAVAEEVLGRLIDARLLTSWETEEAEGQPPRHRIEIVHESLLSAWPRLVRWQTQDADGAQLRDQLRQAAHLWAERGKVEDLLWTGSTYLDFRAWRARYPGKLSSLEEDFSASMAAQAERSRRRRRTAVGAAFLALVVGLAVMSGLWRQSQAARGRAEASKLMALAQLEADLDPTTALAYATKSVEIDDTDAARLFALRLTQGTPLARFVPGVQGFPAFSPDGEWLAVSKGSYLAEGNNEMSAVKEILLLNQDGRRPLALAVDEIPRGKFRGFVFGPDGRTLGVGSGDEIRVLSIPAGRELRHVRFESVANHWCPLCRGALRIQDNLVTFLRRPWDGGPERVLGTDEKTGKQSLSFSQDSAVMAWAQGRKVFIRWPEHWDQPPRLVGEHPADVANVALSADGKRLASVDRTGEVRAWETDSTSGRPTRVLPSRPDQAAAVFFVHFGAQRWVLSDSADQGYAILRLLDLAAPAGAEPVVLRAKVFDTQGFDVDPLGRGVINMDPGASRLVFWALASPPSLDFEMREGQVIFAEATPDGTTLLAGGAAGQMRAWPLSADSPEAFRELPDARELVPGAAVAPKGGEIARAYGGHLRITRLDGGETRELGELPSGASSWRLAYSPDGLKVAAAPAKGPSKEKRIRVWDLETGEQKTLEPFPKADDRLLGGCSQLSFAGADRIVASVRGNGLMLFDLNDGKGKVLSPEINSFFALSPGGRAGVGLSCDQAIDHCRILKFGLDGSALVPLPYEARSEGNPAVALDPTGTLIATSGPGSSVQVGSAAGGEPHLFLAHRGGGIGYVSFSPDGKKVISGGYDQTVRLWPVPDVTKVPPHKRSREEFLATLRTFTNVRAVPDEKSPTGWKLEPGPFPGWKDAPHW